MFGLGMWEIIIILAVLALMGAIVAVVMMAATKGRDDQR
jgi:Tfp pilus assembly protein FimT